MEVYLASVWVHLVAVMLWLGGMLFLTVVLVPVLRGVDSRLRALLVDAAGVRFRTVGWICLGLLVLTGAVNVVYKGYSLRSPLLAAKLVLVGVILVLSFLHDFVVGPRATEAMKMGREEGERLRRVSSAIGRVNMVLGLVVVALGVMLVRGY